MTGIAPDLYTQLQETLLRCAPFESDKELKAIFVDSRIVPWASLVPQATSTKERVQMTIARLGDRTSQDGGANSLILLVQVLRDNEHPDDRLRDELDSLAERLETEIQTRGRLPKCKKRKGKKKKRKAGQVSIKVGNVGGDLSGNIAGGDITDG